MGGVYEDGWIETAGDVAPLRRRPLSSEPSLYRRPLAGIGDQHPPHRSATLPSRTRQTPPRDPVDPMIHTSCPFTNTLRRSHVVPRSIFAIGSRTSGIGPPPATPRVMTVPPSPTIHVTLPRCAIARRFVVTLVSTGFHVPSKTRTVPASPAARTLCGPVPDTARNATVTPVGTGRHPAASRR